MAEPKQSHDGEGDAGEQPTGPRTAARKAVIALIVASVLALGFVGVRHLAFVRITKLGSFAYFLDTDPNRATGQISTGDILRERGMLSQAAECYLDAIRCDPDSPTAYGDLAIVRLLMEDYPAAWSEVHRCVDHGGTIPPDLLAELSRRMPDPGN